MPENNNEVLLKVENLCQFFKMGKGELKAVNNVSFEVKKGEVFGLVGESGCGKTTTGRTIIKLYDATSGNVWFKGRRIVAGTRSYKEAITEKRAWAKQERKRLAQEAAEKIKNAEGAADFERIRSEAEAECKKKTAEINGELNYFVAAQRAEIRSAEHDDKYCDKDYAAEQVAAVKAKYEPLIAAETDEEKKSAIEKEYRAELRKAKRSRLVTQIQMIFQDPIASLDPRMTVRDIIAEGLIIQGEKDKDVIDKKVYQMLELVGLVSEHASRYPHEFSGGQRQRIGVARSIIMNPEMIIADEPVSALDVSIQAQVINLLNDLRDKFGLTILFIAHDLSVVKYFSDRIGVMYYGNMVELASAEELFAHPMHPYTKSLLSAIPLPDPVYERNRRRIVYNPLAEHDYSVDKPSMREVVKGHFIYCNDKEEAEYKRILEGEEQ